MNQDKDHVNIGTHNGKGDLPLNMAETEYADTASAGNHVVAYNVSNLGTKDHGGSPDVQVIMPRNGN